MSEDPETGPTFDKLCKELRGKIKDVAEEVKKAYEAPAFKIAELYPGQHLEMHANITLSYRHLEDAAMRLGKAIQAYDHGKSVYDQR